MGMQRKAICIAYRLIGIEICACPPGHGSGHAAPYFPALFTGLSQAMMG